MLSDLKRIIDQISRDRGFDKTLLIEAIEEAVQSAARKKFGSRRDMEVRYNEEFGEVEVFQFRIVVEEAEDEQTEISFDEARKLVPHQNATTMQVAIGVVSATMWMIENPNKGLCVPDDLPYDYVLKIAKPYLGKFVSEPSDWTPFKNYKVFFKENPNYYLDKKNPWAFKNFLFKD